jgi:integrase/recombinase XerC
VTATASSAPGGSSGSGGAAAVDHIGPARHPHRVTIMRLARVRETYELRWRENVRSDDGTITRVRRTTPGGNSKAAAYARAEKVWRNLDRSGGHHGSPPAAALAAAPTVRTLKQVAQVWLAQHPGKPATVEGYEGLLAGGIWPELTWTDARNPKTGGKPAARRVELGAMPIGDLRPADINNWVTALSAKPDARRRKGQSVLVSPATVHAHLRVLKACLNWAVAHGYLDVNPAAHVTVTVHGARTPEWFRTPHDFWTVLEHIDAAHQHALHDAFVVAAYLGLRVNELAALQRRDVDLDRQRVHVRHNFDKRRRPSTVKSEESETWMPLHPEAASALRHALDTNAEASPEDLAFRGPRGGVITSTLINDALTHGCQAAGLGYRVTAHGLRHSFANWLKTAGVPTRDIQAALRHRDQRTTATYLHTSDDEKTTAINLLPGRQ